MIMTCFTAVLIALMAIIFTSGSKVDPALMVCMVLMWVMVLLGIMGRWVLG